jgi:hypothetical protein
MQPVMVPASARPSAVLEIMAESPKIGIALGAAGSSEQLKAVP